MTRSKGNILLYFIPLQRRSFKALAMLGIPVCQVHLWDLEGKAESGPQGEQGKGNSLTALAEEQWESQPHILCLPAKSTSLSTSVT